MKIKPTSVRIKFVSWQMILYYPRLDSNPHDYDRLKLVYWEWYVFLILSRTSPRYCWDNTSVLCLLKCVRGDWASNNMMAASWHLQHPRCLYTFSVLKLDVNVQEWRTFLPFRSTWVHPRLLVGFLLLDL